MNAPTEPVAPVAVPPPPLPRLGWPRFGSSVVARMVVLFVLTLLFLIPLGMIRSVLTERLGRRNEAVANITSTWGAAQTVCGPVLVVPYRYRVTAPAVTAADGRVVTASAEQTRTGQACFLPEKLAVTGDLAPSVLHRGIYQAVVYGGSLAVSGQFAKPSFGEWHVADADVLWEDATLAMGITDLRGAKETVELAWGDRTVRMVPGSRLDGFSSGVHARLGADAFASTSVTFRLDLRLNGSTGIRFVPLGEQTAVTLASTWPDPSFAGAFLPSERKVGPAGFAATWNVSYYGRSIPQQWLSRDAGSGLSPETMQASAFGVDLIEVVDTYRYVERSIKYGILFVVLVFTAFFLFEVLAPLRVHPFQYVLVGMALCLFYLALLALSEVTRFGTAYLAGAAASTLMIVLYSAAVLRRSGRALLVGVELAVIYTFLFVVLRLQDYSLLFGTAGLFLALGLVMYLTRRIDWYARGAE